MSSQQTKVELLHAQIGHFVAMRNIDIKGKPIVTPEVLQLMTASLTEFIINASAKFFTGQCEHGGDIRDRDLDMELRAENIDTFWYSEAKRWPAKS